MSELDKRLNALYLTVDESVADDIKNHVNLEINRLMEIGLKFRTALMAVKTDAIKCEQSDSPVQYVITQWAMDKVNECFANSEG